MSRLVDGMRDRYVEWREDAAAVAGCSAVGLSRRGFAANVAVPHAPAIGDVPIGQ